MVHPQQRHMHIRHAAGAGYVLGGTKRHNRASGDVHPQRRQAIRPRVHHLHHGLVVSARRQAQYLVHGPQVDGHAHPNRAFITLPQIVLPIARGHQKLRSLRRLRPAVPANSEKDNVLLQDIIAAKSLSPRAKDMYFGGLDHAEEHVSKLAEVRTGGEAARRDEYELTSLAKQGSADGHEQRVDVRLAMHDLRQRKSTRVGLGDLEVRRIGDDHIERGRRLPGEQLAVRSQLGRVGGDEVATSSLGGNCHAARASPSAEVGENGPQRREQAAIHLVGHYFDMQDMQWFNRTARERLHHGAAQNTSTRRRIENTQA